jgi:hypothetical protein
MPVRNVASRRRRASSREKSRTDMRDTGVSLRMTASSTDASHLTSGVMTVSTDAARRHAAALRNQRRRGKLRRASPPGEIPLLREIFSAFVILAGVFAAPFVHAADAAKVDRPSFVFELPPGWEPLSKDGPKNLENYNFYNLGGDVVQLGVSRELTPKAYAAARRKVQAEARKDRAQDGWKLIRTRIVKLSRLGDVDESVYADTEQPLTSYSYNVYGAGRIALVTITFNRRDLAASDSARRIVKGLRWKKSAGPASQKTGKERK